MSTFYVTGEACSLKQFYEEAEKIGWKRDIMDGRECLRGEDQDEVACDVEEVVFSDGTTRVQFVRYGKSSVDQLADHFHCLDEYDEY